ncbi:DUF551 domain-containing protein [Atlantibacter hermannii]|uniref:DUF551 domain-containing protein n=1 Tax=Atlantibacter hermannii TaxID=565 RepID=UPI000EBF24D2|nr:hypothetical protein [Enterobacteriaceae bacterium]
MEWIKWNGQELPKGNYLVCTERQHVTEMKYTWHANAKTKKGSAPRFEWMGRVSPWEITHYMPLPEPPTD